MGKQKVHQEILKALNVKLDFKDAKNTLPKEQVPKAIQDLTSFKKGKVIITFRQGNRTDLDKSVAGSYRLLIYYSHINFFGRKH